MIPLQRGPIPPGRSRLGPEGPLPPWTAPAPPEPSLPAGPGILVTTSRKADPLVRRIGRDLAFAAGGTYHTRGKGGLSCPPFSDGFVLVLSREGRGIHMQILDRMEEGPPLRFPSVKEEPRPGPLKRGFFTGNPGLISCLSMHLPLLKDEGLPESLVFDGVQGRRITLGVVP